LHFPAIDRILRVGLGGFFFASVLMRCLLTLTRSIYSRWQEMSGFVMSGKKRVSVIL